MRVMVIAKATKNSEAGGIPTEESLAAMRKFNDDLNRAGIMLAVDVLHPSSHGKRVTFSGAKRIVTDGPFAETKELIAGYWLWQVRSMEEALEWANRCPIPPCSSHGPDEGPGWEIEIRPIFETEDFGPDVKEQDDRLRSEIERQQKKSRSQQRVAFAIRENGEEPCA